MRIYSLTPLGKRLARSVTTPDSGAYRIVAHLDQVGHSTTEQIAEFCGMSIKETSSILGTLRRKKVVAELSRTTL